MSEAVIDIWRAEDGGIGLSMGGPEGLTAVSHPDHSGTAFVLTGPPRSTMVVSSVYRLLEHILNAAERIDAITRTGSEEG